MFTNDESEIVEFKTSLAEEEKVKETICAFANQDGGTVYLGIDPAGKVVGLGTANERTVKKVAQWFNSKFEPRLYPSISLEDCEGEKIIKIVIDKSQTPYHAYSGKGFVRIGSTNQQLDLMTLFQRWLQNTKPFRDFSALPCDGLSIDDLDSKALERLRLLWSSKSNNPDLLKLDFFQILTDLELTTDGRLNYAALLLVGNSKVLSNYLACGELIFEYRNKPTDIEFAARKEYREPFLLYFDELWREVDARNTVSHLQEGFLIRDIPAFNSSVIREAVLNAFVHRDYEHSLGSIQIKLSPTAFVIQNPGGFLPGITPQNIYLVPSMPRNRRLAEVLQKLGLVERSGQGADKIFRVSLEEGKGLPIYEILGDNWVQLSLPSSIVDPQFLSYLQQVTESIQVTLSLDDLILLERVRSQDMVNVEEAKLHKLIHLGIVESVGRTKGRKYILARRYYSSIGKVGEHIRLRGLDRDSRKQLILDEIKKSRRAYTRDFFDVFKEMKKQDVRNLFQELSKLKKIVRVGGTSTKGYWELVN